MKAKHSFFLCLILIFFTSCAEDIVDVSGSIAGNVRDYVTNELIENCQVSLSPKGTTVMTGLEGNYKFSDLNAGTYTLTFSKIGYEDLTATVEVTAGMTSTLYIRLKPVKPFTVSTDILDFGDLSTSLTFSLNNNSTSKCSFSIQNGIAWLSFNKASGSLQANSNMNLTAMVDRSLVGHGEYNKTVTISYTSATSGEIVLNIAMTKSSSSAPSVDIASTSDITSTSFSVKGNITKTGGSVITSYGHCWAVHENPTINDKSTNLGRTTEVGGYTSTATGLVPNTTYYVRAYAVNEIGTSYSSQITVTTSSDSGSHPGGDDSGSSDGGGSGSSGGDSGTDKSNGFASGSGTAMRPYHIATAKQMQLIKSYPEAYFVLDNDIDMSSVSWMPMPLKGGFDGKNHTLYNLVISQYVMQDEVGLFSHIYSNAYVRDLTIDGVCIDLPERSCVGAIAGCSEAKISGCNVLMNNSSSIILGNSRVGGIVGKTSTNIVNCRVECMPLSQGIWATHTVGGAIGECADPYFPPSICIENVHVKTNVSFAYTEEDYGIHNSSAGGVVGYNYGNIKNCSFDGVMQALLPQTSFVGGIVGYQSRCSITACSAKVSIIAEDAQGYLGGVIGISNGCNTVESCYTQGEIIGFADAGSIVGDLENNRYSGTILNCYSLMEIEMHGNLGRYRYWTEELSYSLLDMLSQYSSPINLAQIMKANCSSSAYWDYSKTRTWAGEVNGQSVTVICPTLPWE